jgi:hypothetical protein
MRARLVPFFLYRSPGEPSGKCRFFWRERHRKGREPEAQVFDCTSSRLNTRDGNWALCLDSMFPDTLASPVSLMCATRG